MISYKASALIRHEKDNNHTAICGGVRHAPSMNTKGETIQYKEPIGVYA